MREIDDTKAPLVEHLIELRRRLIYSLLAIVAAFAIAYVHADTLFAFLVAPYREALGEGVKGQLIYTKLFEAFFVQLRIAMFAAVFVAFPVIANQIWLFVAPGLYRQEKRAVLPFLVATPFLFTLGAALAYFMVMPTAFRFGLSMQKSAEGVDLSALPAIGDYLTLVMHFILAFGAAFLLPVLLLLLERAGIVSRDELKSGRRYAIVVAFVIAAVITPPDVLSQLLLAIPLILLYEIALVVMYFTGRARARAAAAAAAAESAAQVPAATRAPGGA